MPNLTETTDASEWAHQFCNRYSLVDAEGVIEDKEGLMIGWFANAIETGRAAGQKESAKRVVITNTDE